MRFVALRITDLVLARMWACRNSGMMAKKTCRVNIEKGQIRWPHGHAEPPRKWENNRNRKLSAPTLFAVGSAGFVVPVGLLVAGVAVPSLILRLTWRPLAWAGLAVAAISLLSTFTLLAPALDATLPVGRFGSLIWLVIVSVTLPHSGTRCRGRTARMPSG